VVESHPYLVSRHEDVILKCVDDADISIRLRALDLVVGMVNADNLMTIVGRLILQLRNSPLASVTNDPSNDRTNTSGMVPMADYEDDDPEQSIKPAEQKSTQPPPLPDDYRISIIRRILEMCSRNTYTNISDFDWYIEILIQLIRHVPTILDVGPEPIGSERQDVADIDTQHDVAYEIGTELRNVAIRVKSSRREVTRAGELLLSLDRREQMLPSTGSLSVLESTVWIVGEYANYLADPRATLTSIIHTSTSSLPSRTLAAYIQAAMKVFTFIAGNDQQSWTKERQSQVSLMLTSVIRFLEPLNTHPNLEVQERAVEFLELARLVQEASTAHSIGTDYSDFTDPPLLLTQAMPSLFNGMELNPVAPNAQKKVPVPDELDLNKFINDDLQALLQIPDLDFADDSNDEFYQYYNSRPEPKIVKSAAARLETSEVEFSYQQDKSEYLDPDLVALRRAERREQHKDDPFYIPSGENSGTITPLNNNLKSNTGEDLDIDSIPIMELKLDSADLLQPLPTKVTSKSKPRRHIDILADESLGEALSGAGSIVAAPPGRAAKSLLQVDSSALGSLSLDGEVRHSQLDIERREAEDAEMANAMKEIERRRLEMQRASEQVEVKNGPAEGVLVKRKTTTKKKKKLESGSALDEDGQVVKVKKKKKVPKGNEVAETLTTEQVPVASEPPAQKKKKSKRRLVTFDEADADTAVP